MEMVTLYHNDNLKNEQSTNTLSQCTFKTLQLYPQFCKNCVKTKSVKKNLILLLAIEIY